MTDPATPEEDRKTGGKLLPFRHPAVQERLPAVPGTRDPDQVVLEGQVVTEPPPRAVPLRVIRVVTGAARHEHTRTGARHAVYVALGASVLSRRLWDSRSTARYERAIRAAEASGDREGALAWAERLAQFRKDRHARRVTMIELPVKVLKDLPKIAAGLAGILAALGVLLAIATRNPRGLITPVVTLAKVTQVISAILSAAWWPVLLAAPPVTALALWRTGRRHAALTPGWAQTADDSGADITIDETTIARALGALRIPQITDYLKQGFPLQFIVPCRVDGRGTHAVIRLPAGVPADKIARRRPDLASGLYRLAKEVWPTTGSEAGILDIWIADKGALNEGAGPYPLLEGGFTDVFKGLPFGRTLRGDPMRIPVIGRNTICGGMPEQGKSSAARVVACGYTLDIITELRIYVPDINYDFEVFRPRCSRYVAGAEDEFIEQILGDLEELKEELQARGQILQDHEEPEVTRKLAHAGIGLHPVFWLLEEAHVAIQHRKYGKDISQLLCENVKLDRKRGVHMKVSTQAPTKDSMPRDVTRNCANGIAFAVGDHVANDALLGQGAYAGGHRATELIPGTDRGTALCKGFSGQRSEIVQVHFLSVARGSDQVTPLVQRSLAEIARQGRAVPGTDRVRAIETRDLLDDLDEVLGGSTDRVRMADLPGMLRNLAPAWGPYRALTGTRLRELLEDQGVRVTNTGNVPRLDPADLREIIMRRSTEDLDEE